MFIRIYRIFNRDPLGVKRPSSGMSMRKSGVSGIERDITREEVPFRRSTDREDEFLVQFKAA
jgi:hypothetical protein